MWLRIVGTRVVAGVVIVAITGVAALALPRLTFPELYPGRQGLAGIADAVGRAVLHFDFGRACGWSGCPPVTRLWDRGWAADIWMLLGTTTIGITAGFGLGLWCARHTGSRRARVVEAAGVVLYCTPAYVLGLGVLLLFNGTFGVVPLPAFFDATPIVASPLSAPWDWFRSLLVPCLVAAAPLAGMALRLVVAQTREQLDADPVRTAVAKGVPERRILRRHAGPFAKASTASLIGVSAPIVVINLVLVERVFAVQGFFVHTARATGHPGTPYQDGLPQGAMPGIDLQMLAALAIWGAIFIVVLAAVMDLALHRIDPRLRR